MVANLCPKQARAPLPKTMIWVRKISALPAFSASIHRCGLKRSGAGKIDGSRWEVNGWHEIVIWIAISKRTLVISVLSHLLLQEQEFLRLQLHLLELASGVQTELLDEHGMSLGAQLPVSADL
jgi:hypothetical protein